MEMFFREYRHKIPINTVKVWQDKIISSTQWMPVGWSGAPKQPFRHWCSYPDFQGIYKQIWQSLSYDLNQLSLGLQVERTIVNMYNHGDSSWIHRDSQHSNRYTIILYCNSSWDINWAGQTVLVRNQQVIHSISPTPGKFIIFKSNQQHGPRPVSRQAAFPRLGVTFQCISTTQT